MEKYKLNFTHISWVFLVFSLFICSLPSDSVEINSDNPIQDLLCGLMNCGQGKCVASNTSLVGIDCDCNSGWSKIQIGSLTFPSCVIPNCSLNLKCDNETTLPPPPPPPSVTPTFNLSNPCSLVWCGEGSCMANGTNHVCECNADAANLFDSSAYPCFKDCSLGADCKGLGFGFTPPPPPSPPRSSGSMEKGSNGASNYSRNLQAVITLVLVAMFLTCI